MVKIQIYEFEKKTVIFIEIDVSLSVWSMII